MPRELKQLRRELRADAAGTRRARDLGRPREKENLRSASRRTTTTSRRSRSTRERAGHLPTLDLVGTLRRRRLDRQLVGSDFDGHDAQRGDRAARSNCRSTRAASSTRASARPSRSQDAARENLENARRGALFNAQVGYTGVNSSVASVRAFEQARELGRGALESNKLGHEVGVRTNLDVLNAQQQLFRTRRDLAQAHYNT